MKYFPPNMPSDNSDWRRIVELDCYSYFREILPEDIVVDVGAAAGLFTCKALDAGADCVYAVEPDPIAIQNIQKNVGEDNQRVVIVPNALGTDLSWKDFLVNYNIDKIDFLKINTGDTSFYSILTPEHVEWFRWNVRHIALMIYLTDDTIEQFIDWRNAFLNRWEFELFGNKIQIFGPKAWCYGDPGWYFRNDSYLRSKEWKHAQHGDTILMYITNW